MTDTNHTIWIGTSWKMNKITVEAVDWCTAIKNFLSANELPLQPFVVPPFTVLRKVVKELSDSPIIVGAQNIHWEEYGAWTGEISAPMLKDCGASLVEIGHSERRIHFGETDATVGLKTATTLCYGLTPLVCLGETREEHDAGRSQTVLSQQVFGALQNVKDTASMVLFAYEPVWSIGDHGTPAPPDYVGKMHAHIKAEAAKILKTAPTVLYGGSVNSGNCGELIGQKDIDGLFIGRAAWDAAGYIDILSRCAHTIRN
jgi:L-erythrulose 1-phosphate isomerase